LTWLFTFAFFAGISKGHRWEGVCLYSWTSAKPLGFYRRWRVLVGVH